MMKIIHKPYNSHSEVSNDVNIVGKNVNILRVSVSFIYDTKNTRYFEL